MATENEAEVVTLVMDGGTAYVLLTILAMTIANTEDAEIPGAAREILIYAHDQLAGQLGREKYDYDLWKAARGG